MAITAIGSSHSTIALSGYRQVVLLNSETNQWIGALNFPDGDVFAIKFSADGSRLVAAGGVGGSHGRVVCWDTKDYRKLANIQIDDDAVLAMDLSPDGKTLAVGGPKRQVEVIDLATSKQRVVLRKHADWITQLAFSPDGVFLASGDRFGSIYIWDTHSGTHFDSPQNHAGSITALQFSQDSNQLWSAAKDGYVKHWDLVETKAIQSWKASDTAIASMLLANERVIVAASDGSLSAYEPNGKKLTESSLGDSVTCSALAQVRNLSWPSVTSKAGFTRLICSNFRFAMSYRSHRRPRCLCSPVRLLNRSIAN